MQGSVPEPWEVLSCAWLFRGTSWLLGAGFRTVALLANLSMLTLQVSPDSVSIVRPVFSRKFIKAIEETLFRCIPLPVTETLFDFTNTCLEGNAPCHAKAKKSTQKREKRNYCSLVTLGLILDGSGFVRRSRMFAVIVSKASTIEGMRKGRHGEWTTTLPRMLTLTGWPITTFTAW
jgi:hypothetical protein